MSLLKRIEIEDAVDDRAQPTKQQALLEQWTEAARTFLEVCPMALMSPATELIFTGQRLITEARITAEINAARDAALGTHNDCQCDTCIWAERQGRL